VSDERNRLEKNEDQELENDDVEAHRLEQRLEKNDDPSGESDDVEAHRLL
jgi:hypothetical protein